MQLSDAKKYVGKVCIVRWRDRHGCEQAIVSTVHDVVYEALYGAYVILDTDDIRLDHVCAISEADEAAIALEQERLAV